MAAAIGALSVADPNNVSVADRQVRQPDTWLLRRCYQALALHGSADAAFAAVDLIQDREALAPFRVLPVLARRAADDVTLAFAVSQQLQSLRFSLQRSITSDTAAWSEQLLSIACAAAHLDDTPLAFACLERLDQARGVWNLIFVHPERRDLLAETVAHVGLHPLTLLLIRHALRQHNEAGAHFLQQVALYAAAQIQRNQQVRRSQRVLQRCMETFQYATLTSLLSRRYAATIFGLTGDVPAILEQDTIIANIQEARRESGIAFRESEGKVLRQVKRPRANADVDFQFYTLKEAVDHLDPPAVLPQQRALLAERLALLGTRSDGWTAAAATGALLRLGEIERAITVVERIDPRDPTRSEAYRVLVAGLLDADHPDEARRQTQKAIAWAQSLPEHHPERLTIWGIAEAYLHHGKAKAALDVLNQRRAPGLGVRLRRLFGESISEENLRQDALRMYAALVGEGTPNRALPILADLRRQAPKALEGKALALFYTDHVLTPLLVTGHYDLAWSFLHDVQTVLGRILSREQPARVEAVARLLVEQLETLAAAAPSDDGDAREVNPALEVATSAAHTLLVHLWERSTGQGIWPMVYSIGGSLALVIALAGSEAVVEIARFAAAEGYTWRRTVIVEPTEETEVEETITA